jgi:SAM-dependent methyltransferase
VSVATPIRPGGGAGGAAAAADAGGSAPEARSRPPREEIARRAGVAVSELRSRVGDSALEQARAVVDARLRTEQPELLDLPTTPAGVRRRIIEDVDRVNRMLGVYPRIVRRLAPMIEAARLARRGQPVRVLDIGCGAGGLVFRLATWARRRRIPIELTGCDFDAASIAVAQRKAWESGDRVAFRVMDARQLPLAAGEVDVAVTQFMLHHLPPGDAALVLSELDRVAAVNWLAFDLRRNLRALPALWALLRLTTEATTVHDGLVSLRRAYSMQEVRAMIEAAELPDIDLAEVMPTAWTAQRRSTLV